MRPVVQAVFSELSKAYEGRVQWMYLDCKGLVTTGVGNLIEPASEACKLPWTHSDGTAADKAEVAAEWRLVKAHQEMAHLGYLACKRLCGLRLTEAAIDALVDEKLRSNWAFMCARYPCFLKAEQWPAPAQLAASLMAWAVGAGFPAIFKNWARCAAVADWQGCADTSEISSKGNVGVIPRNKAVKGLFQLAAIQPPEDYDKLHVGDIEGAP
jgi:hypothetical protein